MTRGSTPQDRRAGPSPTAPRAISRDPRVDELSRWARDRRRRWDGPARNALAALEDSHPSPATAPALANVAAAAYAPSGPGPRHWRGGDRLVAVLTALGETGARELLRIRSGVRYPHAAGVIDRSLEGLDQTLGFPLSELRDSFGDLPLSPELDVAVPVGDREAVVSVTGDLKRVQTRWRDQHGRVSTRRPRALDEYTDDVRFVEDVRARLRKQLQAVRRRLEEVLVSGESWPADEWSRRMFGDPLRAAMARRLIWQIGDQPTTLALPERDGLAGVDGSPAALRPEDKVAMWHPAEDPDQQLAWIDRLGALDIRQPIEQASRQVTLASVDAPHLAIVNGLELNRRQVLGFLRARGWKQAGSWLDRQAAEHPETSRWLSGDDDSEHAQESCGCTAPSKH